LEFYQKRMSKQPPPLEDPVIRCAPAAAMTFVRED
jgi:hypothetical protein